MKGLRVTSTASSYSVTNSPTLEDSQLGKKEELTGILHSLCLATLALQRKFLFPEVNSGFHSQWGQQSVKSQYHPSPLLAKSPVSSPHIPNYTKDPVVLWHLAVAAKFFDPPGPMLSEQGKS